MRLRTLLLLSLWFIFVNANLEGPFLFFGPKSLEKCRRPALKYLEQDDLTRVYEQQPAIVVFHDQDSAPLSSGTFPRLRKMLEGLTTLFLPQDFLDVHPDYISNETQVLTLQGPRSERDAQMTETFARLQDIYGPGRVLGILGNSVSQAQSPDYAETGEWGARARRQAGGAPAPGAVPAADEERPAKALQKFALYNATGPPGKGALLYSTGWPELQWPDQSVTALDTPVGEPTVKPTRLYTILVVRFAHGDNTRDKITLEFSFKQTAGWWTAVGVEVKRGVEGAGLNLQAPAPPHAPSAVLGYAYHCSLPLVYASENATLTFPNVRMQPYMDSTERFADAFDCITFMSVPIWSGLLVTSIMALGAFLAISTIMGIKTMDRFETNRSKQLTITVND